MKLETYVCPRCGYSTDRKDALKRHFFDKVKTCPAVKLDIELTDDIKHYVLLNRRYHVPNASNPLKVVNNTINNYNQINNFVANMDVIEKLTKYIEYKNIDIVDFEDKVDYRYKRNVTKLENGSLKVNYQLKISDLFDIIDAVSKLCHGMEDFNIMYDERLNKLKIFSFGEWKTLLVDSGIKEMIETIQTCYLNAYECYLIRKMKCPEQSAYQKTVFREHLCEYYKFLICFGIYPYIDRKTDAEIMGIESYGTSYAIEEEYKPLYNRIKEKTNQQELNKTKKDVKEIIKKNTKSNILDLNKKVVELFQMDEHFKTDLLSRISLNVP